MPSATAGPSLSVCVLVTSSIIVSFFCYFHLYWNTNSFSSSSSSSMADLNSLSVSELKKILTERGVSFADCVEKVDLVMRVKETADRPGQMTQSTRDIGDSKCIVFQNSPNPEVVLIISHGYGANKEDFAPAVAMITQVLKNRMPAIKVVLPDAPIAVDGAATRRGWWKIDFAQLFSQFQAGTVTKHVPEGMAEANKMIVNLITHLQKEHNLPLSRFILAGFSQGAMLSCDVALRLSENVGALILLSGSFIAENEWAQHVVKHKGLRVFQSHGRSDPVLPFLFAERLCAFLKNGGLLVEFVSFEGGHHTVPNLYQSIGNIIVDVSKNPK